MKYTITLNKTGEHFKWDEWVAKPKEERHNLIVKYGPGRVELEKEVDNG